MAEDRVARSHSTWRGGRAHTPTPTDSDPVERPRYYIFPNGAEVIDISEWLTSNAAQAFQYLARSSRLDGNNKSATVEGRIEDLQKAVTLSLREIERLRNE